MSMLFLLAALIGQELSLPAVTTTETVGQPIEIKAATDCKEVGWVAMTPGLIVFPSHLLKDSKTAVVWATKAGEYRLMGYTAKGDVLSKPAFAIVRIGMAPGPTPVPPPDPDIPPAPVPVPVILTGFAKEVYEEAKKVADPAAAGTMAANFKTAMDLIEKKAVADQESAIKWISDRNRASKFGPKWASFGIWLGGKLDENAQDLAGTKKAFEAVVAGLTEATKA